MQSIRRARPEDLPAAAGLLAASLRFADADRIPAWLMRSTDECGGITLVAIDAERVVGVSYAMPAVEDEAPILFSCGLAVEPSHRGRGLGSKLKLAQRQEALALGYRLIRWTTDPVNGTALRVYLPGLGARIVGYRAGLHDGLRADPGHPQDDLEIAWHLAGPPAIDTSDVQTVELDDRLRVRVAMSALLADGYVGFGCQRDEGCRVVFARECP